MSLANHIKSADWRAEKHVPVITVGGQFAPGQPLDIEVSVGKEIPHPNTPAHHIAWIALHFVPNGGATSVELGRASLSAHGDSANPDIPGAATAPVARFRVVLPGPGVLHATAYCNLHGLWTSSAPIAVA